MRSATIHEERESQCVIPLFSSWYNQKKTFSKILYCDIVPVKVGRFGREENWVYSWMESKGRERQGDKDTVAAEIDILRCETQFFFFSKTEL